MRGRRWALLTCTIVVMACQDSTAPSLPFAIAPFEPLPQYAAWWSLVESCSAQHADISRVKWRVAIGQFTFVWRSEITNALWQSGSNTIVLGDGWQEVGSVVRHEMLHALVRSSGHDAFWFLSTSARARTRLLSTRSEWPRRV